MDIDLFDIEDCDDSGAPSTSSSGRMPDDIRPHHAFAFGLGFIAGRIDRGDRRADVLSEQSLAKALNISRSDLAQMRRAGVL